MVHLMSLSKMLSNKKLLLKGRLSRAIFLINIETIIN